MIRLSRPLRAVLAGLALAPMLACSSDQGPAASGTTSVSVLLKDAPGDVKKAVVTISEVSLIGDKGEVVLSSTPVTTDLLTLSQDTKSLVGSLPVPSGTYSELRFRISGAYVEVEGSTPGTTAIYASSPTYEGLPAGATVTGSLQMPSLAQSGLKVKFDAGTLDVTGGSRIYVVDFDVSQSFGKLAGNSGMWVLRPVIKGAEAVRTGSVAVTVAPGQGLVLPTVNGTALTLGAFSAVLTNPADNTSTIVPLTDANADGTFDARFPYVGPGSYNLSLQLPAGVTAVTTTPALPVAVTVVSGQQATAALTVTAVQ